MRYFFDMDEGSPPDDVGLELFDMVAVRHEAMMGVRDFIADGPSPEWNGKRFEMRVTDAAGICVLKMQFRTI